MSTPTTLPNQPPLAGDYDLGDGRYCRVTLTKLGKEVTREGVAAGFVVYEAQAWQVNVAGTFVTDTSGWPVRTPGSTHSISLSGLAARTSAREPGWVKYTPQTGTVLDPQAPPEGWASGNGQPSAVGNVGDYYLDLDTAQAWTWSQGEFERIRQGKVEELQQILVERDFEAQVAAL